MNPPSEDVKDMLEAESGLSLTFATNLFIGSEPPEPDDCVTIFDTPGSPPELTFTKGENYFYPAIQVRVRNKSYQDGYSLLKNIQASLHARGHEVWNSTTYELLKNSQEINFLTWDDQRRAIFVATFDIQRQ